MGVYIPGDLADEISKVMRDAGIGSISRVVQESLRLYLAEHSWRTGGDVVGALGIVYDHEARNVDEELTDIQHKYLDVVVSSLHVHLDQRNCLLVVVVKGSSKAVKALVDEIERVEGVKVVRLALMSKQPEQVEST
ncbi:MAG: CopG family ribbon-helix-helix protein [Sulfolobales archaeon]